MSTFLFYTLYSIEFRSEVENLLEMAEKFAENAEITDYNRKSGKVTLQFVSTANHEQVARLCDDFKKEIELSTDARLVYKVKSIVL